MHQKPLNTKNKQYSKYRQCCAVTIIHAYIISVFMLSQIWLKHYYTKILITIVYSNTTLRTTKQVFQSFKTGDIIPE